MSKKYTDGFGLSDYFTWPKGMVFPLNAYLNSSEVECQCVHRDCVEQRLSKDLAAKLLRVRLELGCPMFFTSGFRCGRHQADLRTRGLETASGISTHELGDAVDVRCKDMKKLEQLCDAEFEAMGVARTFIHVDTRRGRKIRWGYLRP